MLRYRARTATRPLRALLRRVYGQSNRFDRIGAGDIDLDPPTASMSSSNRSKSTKATWLTSRPVSCSTVRRASAGPPIWLAELIFVRPTSGISTWRSRGIERKASRRFPGSVRMEHDRVRAVRALASGARAAVCAEHEDRRRRRDEQAVRLRELAAHPGRHPIAGLRDAASHGQVAEYRPGDDEDEEQPTPSRIQRFGAADGAARLAGAQPAPAAVASTARSCERDPPLDPAAR